MIWSTRYSILGLSWSSISLVNDDRLTLVTASSARVADLELWQDRYQVGPARTAVETGAVVCVSDIGDSDDRWPLFAAAASHTGIAGVGAIPLRLDTETIGVLDLCSAAPRSWPLPDLAAAQVLADRQSDTCLTPRCRPSTSNRPSSSAADSSTPTADSDPPDATSSRTVPRDSRGGVSPEAVTLPQLHRRSRACTESNRERLCAISEFSVADIARRSDHRENPSKRQIDLHRAIEEDDCALIAAIGKATPGKRGQSQVMYRVGIEVGLGAVGTT